MAKLPPKKEPQMTVASERSGRAQDIEIEVSSLARKTHAAIEAARSKMTDSEREEADSKARAILIVLAYMIVGAAALLFVQCFLI